MQDLPIHCIVEELVDEAAVRKLFSELSLAAGAFYHTSIPAFEARLRRFNQAARHSPWFALCDLDREECASLRLRRFLPDPAPGMCFRIAVRSVEAWFLADREGIARFLRVARHGVPVAPEDERDPKSRLIALARRSPSRSIREGLVPAAGDRRSVGAEYALMMNEFARDHWSPQRAADRAPSLRRAVERCCNFAGTGRWKQGPPYRWR